MAILLLADGSPRTVQLAHTPPFTLEEIRILIRCETVEAHKLQNAGGWAWLLMDENAKVSGQDKELNHKATEIWAIENGMTAQYMIATGNEVVGDAMLCTAEEFH